jgi:hypothetical protein
MGLQVTEAAPKNGNPIFQLDQDSSDMTTANWALRQDFHFKERARRLLSPPFIGRRNPKRRVHTEQAEALPVHLLPWERVFLLGVGTVGRKAGGRYEGADRNSELAIGS